MNVIKKISVQLTNPRTIDAALMTAIAIMIIMYRTARLEAF